MKQLIISIFLFWGFSVCNAQLKINDNGSSAIYAVNTWLNIVDETDYPKSWNEASDLFKRAVSEDQWVKAVDNVRTPLGELLKRQLKSKKYSTELPGMPDGEYYSFEFNTIFEKKKESVETITAIKEKGNWKIIGYFIR